MPLRVATAVALSLYCAACGASDAPTDLGSDAAVPSDAAGADAMADLGAGGPLLELPEIVRLPYVEADAGGSSTTATLGNRGSDAIDVSLSLRGDDRLRITSATDATIAAATQLVVEVAFAGGNAQELVYGTLAVTTSDGVFDVPVVAAIGPVGLPVATFEPVFSADGRPCGAGATLDMPGAPFPDSSASWTDASVRIFVPEPFEERAEQDIVLHFHGHSTTLASTLAAHRYEEHVCGSGANVILVVPQGPVSAASSNFGKLMDANGTDRFLDQVLITLYRAARLSRPARGELFLTAHSGGYLAVAANLDAPALRVRGVALYDALYGQLATYEAFARGGGRLRSNYTTSGGTRTNNEGMVATLESGAPTVAVSTEATLPNLRDAPAVIDFTPASHSGATRWRNAYGDRVRFGARQQAAGGRIELRSARASGGMATVEFLAPPDDARVGLVVELAMDGGTFVEAARLGATASDATFPLSAEGAVRVRALYAGDVLATQTSDTYALANGSRVLVVDAFERLLGGSFAGRAHDFAARVGRLAGGANTISHRALSEDSASLDGVTTIVWLAGDQSTDDEPVSPAEQSALESFATSGGRLIVSGSEVGFALAGAPFLGSLGATYVSDDAGTNSASGVGSLASIGPFEFGGSDAAYAEDFPDVLSATGGGEVLLMYPGGGAAAVGRTGRSALVGFPLELISDDATLASVLSGLLDFVETP